jgi:RNA polymerase sigma-70 factor (ECF subfamily)
MLAPNDPPVVAPAPLSETHRRQLWRTFHAWTGDRTVAEDLTQETLVAAWQSSQCPASEPDLTRWLFGVARNVLRRHRREQGRIGNAHVDLPDDDAAFALASDSLDLDATLERDEIVTLLDAALSRIPAESRRALLLRYIDDLPQREVADRLGINEKTLEGKLHRGKRAMHRYLVTDGVEQARSLGLVAPGDDWQLTNLWCDACGLQKLYGRWLPDGGLHLECPACSILGGGRSNHTYIDGGITGGLRSFGAASRRVSDYFHDWSLSGMKSLRVCPDCGCCAGQFMERGFSGVPVAMRQLPEVSICFGDWRYRLPPGLPAVAQARKTRRARCDGSY